MQAEPRRARRILDLAAAVVFSALLAAPTVDRLVRPDEARDTRPENRQPAARPSAPTTMDEALTWHKRFADWFEDTAGLRDVLLGVRNTALVRARVSPTSLLDVGPTGWIFYRGDMAFESHRGTYTREASHLRPWIAALEERRRRLEERGVRFVFGLVPDKEAIYPELRPDTWKAIGPSPADVLLERLRRLTKVEVVDLRPVLLAAKAFDQPAIDDFVYYPRGPHWTSRGACAANAAILDHLRAWFPSIEPFDCSDLAMQVVHAEGEDSWAHNLYAPWMLAPSWVLAPKKPWAVRPSESYAGPRSTGITSGPDPSLPSIYFLHDSYGPFLLPFLSQRCSRLRSTWQSWIDEPIVDLERPDVVLMLRAERMLSQPPDADARTTGTRTRETLAPEDAIWKLAGADPLPSIEGGARFEASDGATLWKTAAWTDRFVVDLGSAMRPGERLAILFEIEAPRDGNLDLWLGSPGENEWSGNRHLPIKLAQGRNSEVVVLPDEGFTGRILLRVGPVGSWTFQRLEVHALGEGL